MNTPICDFVNKYVQKDFVRAHMPGHKGENILGFEHLDITEIKGADSLFEAESIIKESEENASEIFSCDTFYSTEGSSLSIRAMMYLSLIYAKKRGKAPLVLAGRNAHKTFLSAIALLDMDVEWLYSKENSYLSCEINEKELDEKLLSMSTKPVAVYLTSPDYLGNTLDIEAIAKVCKKHDVLLLIDNAHGAYLKFLEKSMHPIDLGATMCCDSAHKTLCALTGAAYLHISKNADEIFTDNVKDALSLFASTSPSYLILQSLDKLNAILSDGYKDRLKTFIAKVNTLKKILDKSGYTLLGNEKIKITISTKPYGYKGYEFAEILREKGVECEFCDPDFVVLMLTESMSDDTLMKIESALLSIEKSKELDETVPEFSMPQRVMSVRDAVMSLSKTVGVKDSVGKVLATANVSCPPAVPIVVSGEKIDESAIEIFEYYSIDSCTVVSE
ncbi:MAG: aminotransferase class V-fold PLP-dependent enzyme [Ruminococcus sp.]|nr:aminotransferase class V-fold PLP-dependent enzyme [Ruminococcus sp.]